MNRKLPLIPTIIVLAAFGTMVGLGVWQLQRLQWKEALLARYESAIAMSSYAPFPASDPEQAELAVYRYSIVFYRHSEVKCGPTLGEWDSIAGHNTDGEVGYVHIIQCAVEGGKTAYIQAGWSRRPEAPVWNGRGKVTGIIAPYNKGSGVRLVVDPPLAGLEANARPDPNDIPNNHLSYAIQWFFFAITALVIYALALRKRWKSEGEV